MPYNALLRGRFSEPGRAYLVTTSTYGRKPLLQDFCAARIVVTEMKRLDDRKAVESLGWVVMPDHLHWLFALGDDFPLATVVNCLKGRSARLINEHLQRRGPVWQRGFHDHAIRAEQDVREIARYIVANPLRARLVSKIGEYPHWDAVWL